MQVLSHIPNGGVRVSVEGPNYAVVIFGVVRNTFSSTSGLSIGDQLFLEPLNHSRHRGIRDSQRFSDGTMREILVLVMNAQDFITHELFFRLHFREF